MWVMYFVIPTINRLLDVGSHICSISLVKGSESVNNGIRPIYITDYTHSNVLVQKLEVSGVRIHADDFHGGVNSGSHTGIKCLLTLPC
jgi:hypothetical protein